MLVPHQIIDQRGVFADGFGPVLIRHPRRLHDARVAAHIVHQTYEAFVQNAVFTPQKGVCCGNRRFDHVSILTRVS